MIIENFEELATTPLRKQALLIADAGFEAINTKNAVRTQIKFSSQKQTLEIYKNKFDLKKYKQVICVGFGKVAFEAVTELQNILGPVIKCGFVLDLKGGEIGNITCKIGTHPYPTEINVSATKELLEMLSELTEEDLVICVVGGGGSSLLCSPHDMTCDIQTSIISALTAKAATISELNTVRKHISNVKGGNLAKHMYPATVVSLIFSDVPGDDLSTVASGPTVKDMTTIIDAAAVLKKYDILEMCNLPSCKLLETPKEDKFFEKVHNILVVSPHTALLGMKIKAEELGWPVSIFSEHYEGQVQQLGKQIVSEAKTGFCTIGAGESTVIVKSHGLEGRNEAICLEALPYLKPNQVFLSVDSDGHDHSDAAGGIVDVTTVAKAKQSALRAEDYLANNDSYHFLEATEDLIFTGLTGSNVSDFFVCLTEK